MKRATRHLLDEQRVEMEQIFYLDFETTDLIRKRNLDLPWVI